MAELQNCKKGPSHSGLFCHCPAHGELKVFFNIFASFWTPNNFFSCLKKRHKLFFHAQKFFFMVWQEAKFFFHAQEKGKILNCASQN